MIFTSYLKDKSTKKDYEIKVEINVAYTDQNGNKVTVDSEDVTSTFDGTFHNIVENLSANLENYRFEK
jgi:actin-like ATPase involved in cell morphogenesis